MNNSVIYAKLKQHEKHDNQMLCKQDLWMTFTFALKMVHADQTYPRMPNFFQNVTFGQAIIIASFKYLYDLELKSCKFCFTNCR